MLHLAAVAVGAPQVPRFVVALPSLLVHVTAADPGHMHCCRLLAHTATIGQNIDPDLYDTPTILATLRRPRQVPIPGEGNDPYSELRQLRANERTFDRTTIRSGLFSGLENSPVVTMARSA